MGKRKITRKEDLPPSTGIRGDTRAIVQIIEGLGFTWAYYPDGIDEDDTSPRLKVSDQEEADGTM